MNSKVLDIIAKVTQKKVGELELNLEVKGLWDSLTQVEIVLALEESLQINFTQEQIARMVTTQQILDCVKEAMSNPL